MSGGSAAQKAAAQLAGVSVSTVQRGGKVREHGVPELEQAIRSGRATLGSAYWLAMNCAPEEQRWALGEAGGSTAKLSRLVAAARRGSADPHECACRYCGRAMPGDGT